MKLSHEILMILAYVSQLSDPDLVRLRFLESLNGLNEGFTFKFVDCLPAGLPECRVFPIATIRSSFGYAVITESSEAEGEYRAVCRNAFKFLATLLENRMQQRALESRNESLMEEINIEKSLVRTVLDTLPVGVWVADKHGKIMMGNVAAEKIWDSSGDIDFAKADKYRARRSDTDERIEPKDWGIARAIETGKTVIGQEIDIDFFDGTLKTILHSAAPLLSEEGKIIGAVGVNQDISERKIAENKALEAEQKYRDLFESIRDAILVADVDRSIIDCNPAFIDLFGYSIDEIRGKKTSHVYENEKQFQKLGEALKAHYGESSFFKTVNYKKKNGEVFPGETGVYYLKNQKDEVTGFIGLIRDVTTKRKTEEDKKKMEAQLIQARKMESIGHLAGGIAHDFNNILSAVIGFTELALDDVAKGTPLEDSLQEVYTGGKRARDLVKQILAFARQSDEEQKPLQVDTIAKEVLKLIRSTIPATIEIKENIESRSFIMGNPSQIHQLFMNLCTNAAQAMEDTGGILEVGVTDVNLNEQSALPLSELKPGNYIKITVSDSGSGISPDIIGSVFDPYFSTKGVGEGTGMGLAIVHGIVETYGGKITVESELGGRTFFSIHLPINKKRETHRPYEEEALPSGGERILFVDDELPIAKMGSQILDRLGYRVTSRTSSIDALELFRSNPDEFDLVITDMTMPNMTGLRWPWR